MEITNVPIGIIKIKFRLRDPDQEKVVEIAESISKVSLLNPITLDTQYRLLAGYHRLLAFKYLKRETIPAVIKDVDEKYGELCEIDENLKRFSLSIGNTSRHIIKREKLMKDLGFTYQQGDNRFTTKEEKITVEEMADGIGVRKRAYQQ